MVLLYIFAGIILVNILYYVLFSKVAFYKPISEVKKSTTSVSVLVCAKNEAENLKKTIPLLLSQQHRDFEIILINDCSSDDTLDIMESYQATDERIKIVDVVPNEAFWANKKYALTLGIKKAKYKHMLFIDADCWPNSPNWITTMSANFNDQKQLVLGYGAYDKKKGFLNKLIRYETLATAIQYFSYAKAGLPYMGVGRNLGYTSELYYSVNGFISHIRIPSGDDDLFVNEAATKENTVVSLEKEGFTISNPKTNLSDWIKQKRRHVSTAKQYKTKHKFLLGSFFTFNLLFWIFLVLCFIFCPWMMVTALVVLRLGVQWVIYGGSATVLKEKDLIYYIPILDLFLTLLQLSIFIKNATSKPASWK
ncbi:putative transmembrane glycosyltransferase [unidentified eubacterium SCB49]|nr:putative transmembrane glycosyltransferase [unidentified eubacterium SCB49]